MTPVDVQLLSELRLCVRCFNVRGSVIAAAAAAAAAVAAAAAAATADRNAFAAGTQDSTYGILKRVITLK